MGSQRLGKAGRPRWTPEARAEEKARRRRNLLPREPPVPEEFKRRFEAIIAERLKAVAEDKALKTVASTYALVVDELRRGSPEYFQVTDPSEQPQLLKKHRNWVNWRMRRVKQQLVAIHRGE